ncbi:hypothetical protein KUTeg_013987 [Tegillarca granosa]|uniref:Cap-specific mRNA (nucleoside-2'-O-)-methyltransferase 1 n=1 Tax=Tegillarca granosa TaxID=220873 RepID=A0ABQ9EVA7_TEGGR|nr:hypothetical protein KUTeg_013987 [Tegillarca granosa]
MAGVESGSLTDSEDDEGILRVSLTAESDGDSSEKDLPKAGLSPPSKKMKIESEKKEMYTDFAQRMMAKMGYQKGKGLGKNEQGRVEIVESSKQRGRRGLGLQLKGLEASNEAEWDFEADEIVIDEEVEWLPHYEHKVPPIEVLRKWKIIGKKKQTIDDETEFCDEEILTNVLNSKSVFDQLEPEEMRRARTRSNPYETIRGVFFLNRAAMKMANMDAVLDFMFTSPKHVDGTSMVGPNDLLYFADICAGPGGFSEYVLWRSKAEAKGFGMTLKGQNDFKLEEFLAGPAEMFETHYGVGGIHGDGDIFNSDNQAEFTNFVKQNTESHGVHFVMADGGFSVEGQENIQEILSKQLYLCQFLVALSVLRKGGHFVCKLFDLFTRFSMGLVYLMYMSFDRVSIYKPVTSRPANSERYIVCRNMKSDIESVRQYMHEINVDLNKYMSSTSLEDVTDVVPLDVIQNDKDFFTYMYDSNNSLGKLQIMNLHKIKIFTQNNTGYLNIVPDEFTTTELSAIKTPYDYRCYVVGGQEKKRWYLLGLGRSYVFKWDGQPNTRWKKLDDDRVHIELPSDTLIEIEFVQELKGEGSGQKRLMTLHVLDAMFLYGKDVRGLHFNERMDKLRKFVKSITKTTRPDLTPVIVPDIFRLEQIHLIFERICYCPERPDGRSFLPRGVCIVKTVKDPWTVALSKSQGRKYFYNLSTRESKFEIPKDMIVNTIHIYGRGRMVSKYMIVKHSEKIPRKSLEIR